MPDEPSLAGRAIIGHRPLGQMLALVGSDDHTPRAPEPPEHPDARDREPRKIPHDGCDHITRVAWRRRADPLYTSRMKILWFLLVTLAACAGTQQEETTPPIPGATPTPPPPPTKAAVSADVSFEIPVIEIKGTVFEPELKLGMPVVPLKKPTTLDKQRALVKSVKDPLLKQARAAELASMLYHESKTNKATEKALLTEARQVLRDVAQLAGDKAVDDFTLQLLGSYELLLEDYAAAEKRLQALIDKDPKSKDGPENRLRLAYALLKQFKNTEALAVVAADPLDDQQPELAYVTAWAKLRTNDIPGAWEAITTAARGWDPSGNRDDLERDVLMFAGRANITLDQAVTMLTTVLAKTKPQQYELLARLGIAGYDGRWGDGVVVLDKAIALAGAIVPANDLPRIRASQAEFLVQLDTPEVAVKYAQQAVAALGPCGAKCNKDDIVQRMYFVGRLFHNLYATANDRRYYQPAHDLYALTIPLLPAATRSEAQGVSDILEKTLKNTKAGTGTHDKGTLGVLLNHHNLEVEACYEATLSTNPKFGGTLTLTLDSDASGAIKGVATEPAAGLADLAAVAGCVADHAKQWKLPKRGMAGSTRIKMSYTLAVK